MDSLKEWLLEVGIKKMGPSALRAGFLAVGGFIAAKAGMFSSFGVVYDKVNHLITIDLNQLNAAATTYLIGSAAAGGALIKMLNHHADEVVLPIIAPSVVTPKPTDLPK